MRNRLLRVPESFFPGEAERFISPSQRGVFEKLFGGYMRRDVVCPGQNFGNDVLASEWYRANDGAGRVQIFGGEESVASLNGRRELALKDRNALPPHFFHYILCAQLQYSGDKGDKRVEVGIRWEKIKMAEM